MTQVVNNPCRVKSPYSHKNSSLEEEKQIKDVWGNTFFLSNTLHAERDLEEVYITMTAFSLSFASTIKGE